MEGIYRKDVPDIIKYVHNLNIISDQFPSLEIVMIDLLKRRINNLITGFNSVGNAKFNFAYAIKANCFTKIVEVFKEFGCGAECASFSEVLQAIHSGIHPSKIVFDSPCKQLSELKKSIELGICLNADNFDELNIIDEIFRENPELLKKYKGSIGVRINPQLRAGEYTESSTATKTAHFGVPLIDNSDKICDCYIKYEWLNGIHLHMGSQGICIDLLVDGIKSIYDLANTVNNKIKNKIKVIDIGGGLPIDYNSGNDLFEYSKYANILKDKMPNLFNGDYIIYTEFGNSTITKCVMAITKIEYVKQCGDINTIIGHLGVNYYPTCYFKGGTPSNIFLFDEDGNLKTGDEIQYRIVGPLCFSGDVVKEQVLLPQAISGDMLLILDTGSYRHSRYAMINSIPRPPVIGITKVGGAYSHFSIYKGETYEDTLKLWE